MPESRSRKKAAFIPPPTGSGAPRPNPRWYAPVMVGLMLLGLAWIVTTYMSDSRYPIPGISSWNLAVGFGLMLVGFGMTTRWR